MAHWNSIQHLLRYLNGTVNYDLLYKPHIQGYTDADYLSCLNIRRSVGAYIFKLASGSVSWSSKQEPTIFDSTTEAEYKTLSEESKR